MSRNTWKVYRRVACECEEDKNGHWVNYIVTSNRTRYHIAYNITEQRFRDGFYERRIASNPFVNNIFAAIRADAMTTHPTSVAATGKTDER